MNEKEQLEEALKYHQQGEFEKAKQLYTQILASNPLNADANYLLGSLYCQIKRFSEAEQLVLKAIELEPDRENYHINLGYIYETTGKDNLALSVYRKALSINSEVPLLHFNLANVYARLQEFESATVHFKKTVELDPDNYSAFYNLGNAYIKLQNNDEAIEAYENCLRINENYINALINLSELYEKSNQTEKVEQCVSRIIQIDPDNPFANMHKARLCKRNKQYPEALKILTNIPVSNTNINVNIEQHFLLGEVYDKTGEFDSAYNHFREGNDLARQQNETSQYGKNTLLKRVKKYRENCPGDGNLFQGQGKLSGPSQFFLFGFPRSGNTLVGQILDTHPQINTLVEKMILDSIIGKIENRYQGMADPFSILQEEELSEIRKYYIAKAYEYGASQNSILVDSNPMNIIYVDKMMRIFPHAKFILVIRHPYDACFSNFMMHFEIEMLQENFYSLRDSAILYDSIMSLWQVFEKKLHPDVYVIKYENLIESFELEIRKLLQFMSVAWDPSVLEYHNNSVMKEKRVNTASYDQVIQPLYTGARYRWKSYKKYLIPVADLLNPYVEYFGYKEPPAK